MDWRCAGHQNIARYPLTLRTNRENYKLRGGLGLMTLAVLSMVALLSVACQSTAGTVTYLQAFIVDREPSVDVEVGNGAVSVSVGSLQEVIVSAELRDPDNVEYSVTQAGDLITVKARTRSSKARADITLTVPENATFALQSGNGDVDVREIRASGSIAIGNGSISLAGVNGDVVGNLGNGRAEATRYSGSLIMNTGNGAISISDADGSFDLNSGNGGISVTGGSGSFDLNAGNGAVILQAELITGSRNNLASGNGSITAEIEGTPNVFLDLETEEGNITTNVAVNVKEESERHLIGTIGEGSASLRIRTGKGNITIN